MSEKPKRFHSHLKRLSRIYPRNPVYFVTTTVFRRKAVLADPARHDLLREEWKVSAEKYGWRVGRYTIMPDHVHFFCTEDRDAQPLSKFVGKWKEYSSKALRREVDRNFLWQEEFFDHLLRSGESYSAKWKYVAENPVRAGFVEKAEDWPFSGEIHQIESPE